MHRVINPVVFGDYPAVMREVVGSRLPNFTGRQSKLVKGSADFIGINHYTSCYISDNSNTDAKRIPDFNADMFALFRMSREDPPTNAFIPFNFDADPKGLQLMLEYFRDVYDNIPVYVEENGLGEPANRTIYDTDRIEYLNSYIGSTLTALRNGANVKGYFVWTLMDVFEFLDGYQSRYGLYYVDFKDENRPRQPKMSAHWYSNFIKSRNDTKIERNIQKSGSSAWL
ncbi:hypothetical protein LUZ61_020967 [Rhynchospora tenuis]|uniref:4-hydroxy-7-methoxy-3-oxo-3,4-dihydro-2H-1,4-benzoxazin-2-yl glucosidebeta-D-glucosidase n=1 Tax=Rhynchospora tenuis TaxID=198213 RepID=A0AAD6EPB8_9POAL|nr:hypothetical protein LUZ61_020967 [Rhynchospora tenuis]